MGPPFMARKSVMPRCHICRSIRRSLATLEELQVPRAGKRNLATGNGAEAGRKQGGRGAFFFLLYVSRKTSGAALPVGTGNCPIIGGDQRTRWWRWWHRCHLFFLFPFPLCWRKLPGRRWEEPMRWEEPSHSGILLGFSWDSPGMIVDWDG